MALFVLLQDQVSAPFGQLKAGELVDSGESRYTLLVNASAPFVAHTTDMDSVIASYRAQARSAPERTQLSLSAMLVSAGLMPENPEAVIDAIAANEDDVDFNAQKLTDVGDPAAPQDAVTLAHLEANTVAKPAAAVVAGNVVLFDNVAGNVARGSLVGVNAAGRISQPATLTAPATVGDQVINNPLGSVNFAAAADTLVVTSSQCTVNSIVTPTVMTDDATAKSCIAIPGAGSFTLKLNAAATAETRVGFRVDNG